MTEPVVERLSFAYREVDEINPRIVHKFGHTVKDLDLSNNNISDLSPLQGFVKLQVLVLDGNKIASHTKIPPMEKLHTLWVNNNNITNLTVFIDKLVESTPNLKFLSMLKNEACPNFFNGHSLKDYNDYRRYVISRMPGLTCLDSTPITDAERAEGDRLYSSTITVTSTIAKPLFYATSSDAIQAPGGAIPKRREKYKKRSGKSDKKATTSESSKKNTTGDGSVLPEFPLDNSKNTTAPPPLAPHSNGLAHESDFDDSSDSSSWSDDDVES